MIIFIIFGESVYPKIKPKLRKFFNTKSQQKANMLYVPSEYEKCYFHFLMVTHSDLSRVYPGSFLMVAGISSNTYEDERLG